MNVLETVEEVKDFVTTNRFAFVYAAQKNCSVCHAVLPKLKNLLEDFPDIALGYVDVEDVSGIAAEYLIFSAPTLLFFIDEKEFLREGRFVRFSELEEKLRMLCIASKEQRLE